MRRWWQESIEQVVASLDGDLSRGLTTPQAAARLVKYGANRLEEKKGASPLSIFVSQFRDFIIWVLIGAALVSGFLQEWVDAIAIVAIVILNAFLGFIQEYHAERALAALKKLSSPASKVIRDGHGQVISSHDLVPGDIVELEAGDSVPADSRIGWLTSNFAVQEASLTGESTPVAKTVSALSENETPLADRANLV
jgi:Ca2+-transporting ATPase